MKTKSIITAFVCSVSLCLLGAAGYCFVKGCSHADSASQLAKDVLIAQSVNPESIKINNISKPDSVFGRCYLSDNDKMYLSNSLMKVTDLLMEQDLSFEDPSKNDPRVMDLISRQMTNQSQIAPLINLSAPFDTREDFSGWKVKIDYEEVNPENKIPYHGEKWFIIDPKGKFVIYSFDIPIL